MRRNSLGVLAIVVCLSMLLARSAAAEDIQGTVTDPSGAVIPGATVQILAQGRVLASSATDVKGAYVLHLSHLEATSSGLEIRVSAPGFATASRQLDFSREERLIWSVRLELQTSTDQVHVEARTVPFCDQLDISEVRESSARDLGEALASVDGVHKVRKAGIANDVIVRGFQHDNVNLLVDGARIYGACPGHMDPPAEHVDFAEVERVDIVKGAFDADSAGSLGARLDVVTKTAPLGLHFTPSLSFGSFGFFNPSLTASFGNSSFRVLAGYSFRASDPYKDGFGKSFLSYANYSAAARNQKAFEIHTGWFDVQWTPTADQTLAFYYARQQAGPTLYPYASMDSDYDNADRATVKYDLRNLSSAIHAISLSGYFTQIIHFMSDRYRTSAAMAMGSPWMMAAEPRSRVAGGRAEFDAGKELTFGFEGYHRNWNMLGYMFMNGMMTANPSLPNVDTNLVGVFVDYRRTLTDRLKLSGGLRFDHADMSTGVPNLSTDLYFKYQNTRATSSTDNYGSGNLRLTYSLSARLDAFVGVGVTGRVPDAQERFIQRPSMSQPNVGDPNLPTVRNTEVNAGAIYRRGSSYFKPVLFFSHVDNYILVNDQPLLNSMMGMASPYARSFTNVDAHFYGGEASYGLRLPAGFSLRGGTSYSRATNAPKPQAGVFSTNIPEMPPLRTWAALRYTHKWGFAEIGGTGVGRQGLVDTDLHETPTAGYALMDLKAGLLYRKFSFTAVVDNLLNRFYYEHLSYYRDPFASGTKVPEPGRNFFGQLQYKF